MFHVMINLSINDQEYIIKNIFYMYIYIYIEREREREHNNVSNCSNGAVMVQ